VDEEERPKLFTGSSPLEHFTFPYKEEEKEERNGIELHRDRREIVLCGPSE